MAENFDRRHDYGEGDFHKALAERLASVHQEQGRLAGRMEALGFKLREEVVLRTATL